MFRLVTNRKAGADSIPGRVTTLSVSWLNGQFKAMAVNRGVVEGTWEHEGEVSGAAQFEALLREAVEKTGYRGQTVSLLLGHPRLVQQVLDVPPVKSAALRKILQRQALQQKMFAGEATWTSQRAQVSKDAQRIVMHLLPRAVLNQLIQACHRVGLYLTSVAPPSAVLQMQLKALPLEKNQAALLAAETGGSTTVIIGRGDGQVLLARTLAGNWNESAEQLALDLNRTLLYFNEQYGAAVNEGIWLFGPGAPEQCAKVQRHTQIPVAVSPISYSPLYWATTALKVRAAALPNFISPEMQQAPQRRIFANVVALATFLVVVALLALSAYAVAQTRQEGANVRLLSGQLKRLEARRLALHERNLMLVRREQIADLVLDSRLQPVPLWFLGFLGEAVPSELVVTNLHIQREFGVWKVHLAGTLQTALNQSKPPELSSPVALLTQRLTNGPFHFKLMEELAGQSGPPAAPKPSGPPGGIESWIANVLRGVTAQPPTNAGQFAIDGVMR